MKQFAPRTLLRAAAAGTMIAAFPLTTAASSAQPKVALTPPIASVVAQPTATPTPPPITKLSASQQATRLATLKTRGDAEITRRITNLNTALTQFTASTTLTASDKSALTSQAQTELTGLATLKTKLDADTTLADARTDVQSIFTDYRVYALMLPKVRLVTADDRLATVETKLTALATQLQTAIASAQSSGKDVTAMKSSLADMQAKTAAASTATNNLVTELLALQPTDYNTNHAVLETYRASLGTAITDVTAARNDAASIIAGLSGTSSPSPSASPATSPTASPVAK